MIVQLIVDAFLAAAILAFIIFLVVSICIVIYRSACQSPEREAWNTPDPAEPGPLPSHFKRDEEVR